MGDQGGRGVSGPEAQYRAELDFEITFCNGGGLRGAGFRVDIAGPSLTEPELGAALVAGLSLLVADRRTRPGPPRPVALRALRPASGR